MRIILLRIFNVTMAFVALLALLIAVAVARLMMGPVTTTSLTPWVERALSQPKYGIMAKVNQSTLHWDSINHQVVLEMNGVQFQDALGQKVSDVPEVVLMLSPFGYFHKEHSPWVVTVRHPQVHLRIDAQNKLRLGALQAGDSNILERDEETTLTAEGLRDQLKTLARGAHGGALGLFSDFTIEDAGVTLIDEPHNEMWSFSMPLLSMKRVNSDHEGSAKLHITKDKLETDIDLSLRYSNKEKLFHAVMSFTDIDPVMFTMASLPFKVADYSTARLSGAVTLVFSDDLDVKTGMLNLVMGEGAISVPDYFSAPLKMKKATVAAAYTASSKTLSIEPVTVEMEKVTLGAAVKVKFDGDVRTLNSQLKLSNLRLEDLPMYWPESAAPNARVWILENMKHGLADELTANIDASIPGDDFKNTKLDRLDGTISLKQTEVRYWEPLPPIENASATAKYDTHHFDIDVLGGEVGPVKLKPSHMIISGLDAEDQIATIEAHLAGPAQDTMKILNRPPLKYADKMKIDPAVVSGTMEGVIKTSFPLLKALLLEQMGISAEVKLINVGVKKIVDLLSITNANVSLGVDTKQLSIDGEATVNGVPAHVRWDEKFQPAQGETLSHGVANATTEAQSAVKFGVEFPISSDPMPVTVVYDRYENLSKLSISADATKSSLDIPDVSYHKIAGASANIAIGLDWGGGSPPRLSKIDLSGQSLNVKGQGNFDSTGKVLTKLTLDPLVIGKTKARLDFLRGSDNVPQWSLTGDALDVSGFFEVRPTERYKTVVGEIEARKPAEVVTPLRLNVQVNRLITGANAEFGNTTVKGTRDSYGWALLNIATVAVEQTPFNFTLGPQGARTLVEVNTPNLGNVLRSLDVTDTVKGGKLNMDGSSDPNDVLRSIFGHIKLKDFRVSDMPFLLTVLGAISPDGQDALGRTSLQFSDLSSEYIWNKDSFIFTKANTSTGTLGLTAAGKIDLVNYRVNLEGQVIPIEFISKIIGAIPVIGDILTGGNGHGLFAATYTVKGPLTKPVVTVNPVSILAPGIIRDILFTDPNIAKEKKPTPPPAATSPNPPVVH